MTFFVNYGKVIAVSNYGRNIRVDIERFGIYNLELFQEITAKVGDTVEIRILKELQPDFSETTTFTFISHLRSGNGSNINSYYLC